MPRLLYQIKIPERIPLPALRRYLLRSDQDQKSAALQKLPQANLCYQRNRVSPDTSFVAADHLGNVSVRKRQKRLIPGADEFEVLPTCPKCSKQYAERSAMSREYNKPICPMCGYKEAITFLPDSMQEAPIALARLLQVRRWNGEGLYNR